MAKEMNDNKNQERLEFAIFIFRLEISDWNGRCVFCPFFLNILRHVTVEDTAVPVLNNYRSFDFHFVVVCYLVQYETDFALVAHDVVWREENVPYLDVGELPIFTGLDWS